MPLTVNFGMVTIGIGMAGAEAARDSGVDAISGFCFDVLAADNNVGFLPNERVGAATTVEVLGDAFSGRTLCAGFSLELGEIADTSGG